MVISQDQTWCFCPREAELFAASPCHCWGGQSQAGAPRKRICNNVNRGSCSQHTMSFCKSMRRDRHPEGQRANSPSTCREATQQLRRPHWSSLKMLSDENEETELIFPHLIRKDSLNARISPADGEKGLPPVVHRGGKWYSPSRSPSGVVTSRDVPVSVTTRHFHFGNRSPGNDWGPDATVRARLLAAALLPETRKEPKRPKPGIIHGMITTEYYLFH